MKPGRPVAMGVIDGTPFIGLPGNPVASFVTFARVARPAILALAGADWTRAARHSGPGRVLLSQETRAPRIRARAFARGPTMDRSRR